MTKQSATVMYKETDYMLAMVLTKKDNDNATWKLGNGATLRWKYNKYDGNRHCHPMVVGLVFFISASELR
jgi:hypothetical protein